MVKSMLCAALGWALLAPAAPAFAKMSVVSSPHNLSASGGGGRTSGLPGVSFAEEKRICVFCHVPHHAENDASVQAPLWSRRLGQSYQPYVSTTINASPKPSLPTGASRLCLSCHDGTIGLGSYVGSQITTDIRMPTESSPSTNPNLGTDLRDDHPISFPYTAALASKSHLASPSNIGPSVKLSGDQLECTACHDPHDNEFGNFLVMNNSSPDKPGYVPGSPLCTTCHKPTGWDGSSHNPANTPSLAKGCMNCHAVHTAATPMRLLNTAKLEDNCYLSCHNGSDSTSVNVKPLFDPGMYRHPVDDQKGEGAHDEKESLPAQKYHVQCVDCHNPHQASSANAPLSAAPAIDGRLSGVRIDDMDSTAVNEYQVCFKCHAGTNASSFAGVTEMPSNRMISDPNEAYRFDSTNPSYHPVTANSTASRASLLTTFPATQTRIYCTDCHNNNLGTKAGGTGPNGPHGSQYPHILIAEYDMPLGGSTQPYNMNQYALCYRCHSETYVMGTGTAFYDINTGFNEHARHVRDRMIPCFACHDPHGVSAKLGATAANNAHLINFDKSYASGAAVPTPLYTVVSAGAGSCTVNCHTVSGNTESYASSTGAALRMLRLKALRRR
jgi:hypothetical protein